ncbi:hypothetical protein [Escherichia coli]|uniref:hypothetical protein n=1 Tax=Escherichia coli TaxID=562 RepID=UPI003CE578B9
MAKIVSKNDPDTKKVWFKYGKIPGQGDGVNLFFVGEINVTHYFITNIGAGLPVTGSFKPSGLFPPALQK